MKPNFLGNRKRVFQSLSSKNLSNEAARNHSDSTPTNNIAIRMKFNGSADTVGKQSECPDEAQTTLKEWNALYTTQITKKSKSYHDGILRLVRCGSHMNQVILLHEDGTVLSSKYLKSIECVETGHDYAFPNYLVQICEPCTLTVDNISGSSLKQVADCRSSRLDKFTSNHKVTRSNSIPKDIKKEHPQQVDCGDLDHAKLTSIAAKSTHEWNALYTTQKTQKAKKYHDGILQVVTCGSHMKQAILLNEEGAVLSSKYLKTAEHVEPGNTYDFPNYVVEVCEPKASMGDIQKEHSEPVPNCISSDNGRLINHNDKQILDEWDVMLTTQMTQKAKKYHDGFLQIINCGLHMKKVILLNEDRAELNSKYLKSVECIKKGHTIEFPNYLVDICARRTPADDIPEKSLEQVADSRSSNTSKFTDTGNNNSDKSSKDIQKAHSEQSANCIRSDIGSLINHNDKQILDEWDVLFTTQMMQKAKKYCDGILRVTRCGLHMKQVILLNEDGTVLSSKYIRSVECIKNGHTFEFPNYLVDICARRTPADDIAEISLKSAPSESSNTGNFSNARNDHDVQNDHVEDFTAGVISDRGKTTNINNRPIRDASQILSFLRRPVNTPHPSDAVLLDEDGEDKMLEVNVPTEDNHKGNTIAIHSDSHGKTPSQECSSYSYQQSGEATPNILPTEIDMEYTVIKNECLSIGSNEVSDSNVCGTPKFIEIISSEDGLPSDESPGNKIEADKNRSLTDEIMELQQEWIALSHRVSKTGYVKSLISFPQNENTNKRCEIAQPSGTSLPVCVATDERNKQSLKKNSNTCLNVEEFPTFDLGFE